VSRSNRLRNIQPTRVVVAMFSTLLFSACSYVPSVTKVPENKLAEYNPKHFSPDSSANDTSTFENEDSLIMKAIFYEQQEDFEKSNYYYDKLYQETGKEEYLFREMGTALFINKKSKNLDKLQSWVDQHPNNVKAKRILLSSYLANKQYDKAKAIGELLIRESGMPIDFELASNPYIMTGEYAKAVELLTQAYNKTFNADILIKITTLLANYIGDVDEAVKRLENHRHLYECNERVCLQLAEIYSKQEKIPELLSLYRDLYKATGNEQYAVKLIEGYVFTKETDKAIAFLTNEYQNDELLYELYLSKKDYKKAQIIAQKVYERGRGPRWLAESAMALYEQAENKDSKPMLDEVVKKFEKAINEGARDGVYLNYYGYTLIDKDIDIARGVDLIKEALAEDPNNTYYLDSLAWGYYKLHHCKEAYQEMKKVVDIEGLEEDEIREHWLHIKKCNKQKGDYIGKNFR